MGGGETASGKLTIFQNAIGNIKEEIGTAFLPLLGEVASELSAGLRSPEAQAAIAGLAGFIKSDVIPNFVEMARWIGDNKTQMADLTKGVVEFMGTPLGTSLQAHAELMRQLNPLLGYANDLIKSLNISVGVELGRIQCVEYRPGRGGQSRQVHRWGAVSVAQGGL